MNKDVKIGLAIGLLGLVALFVWWAFRTSGKPTKPEETQQAGRAAETSTVSDAAGKGRTSDASDYTRETDDGLGDNIGEVAMGGREGTGTDEITELPADAALTEESKGFDPGTTDPGTTDTAGDGGGVVEIPETEVVITPPSYVVKPGDVLSKISEKVYGSSKHWRRIAEANKITDPATELYPDMVLVIPKLPESERTRTALPLPVVGERRHTVAEGDVLSTISEKYYGTIRYWREIAKANRLTEDDILRVGTVLIIPKLTPAVDRATVTPDIGEKLYVVKPGDTLEAISKEFYGNGRYHKLIQEANKIADPMLLRPGQKIIIPRMPGGGTTPRPRRESGEPRLEPGERRYIVQEDETLSEIAERELGSKNYYPILMKRNNIADARALRVGQIIVIPSRSAIRVLSSVIRED